MNKRKTECFNDGLCSIYDGKTKRRMYENIRFQNRVIGVKRHFAAAQSGSKVDQLIRIPQMAEISTNDYVEIEEETYAILQVQVISTTNPRTMDLSLWKTRRV